MGSSNVVTFTLLSRLVYKNIFLRLKFFSFMTNTDINNRGDGSDLRVKTINFLEGGMLECSEKNSVEVRLS